MYMYMYIDLHVYIVCYHANYYARLQVESNQSFQENTCMYMYMFT